jgi:epoxyqueuosine reductase
MTLVEELESSAREAGFVGFAVTSAEPLEEAGRAAAERTREGLMDGLTWWNETRARASADPRLRMPSARSVITLAFPHAWPSHDFDETEAIGARGRIAAYALGLDYHDVLIERMSPLVRLLLDRGYQAKTFVDHGWLLDRAAAARAGLGWLGKNTNLLVPGIGSRVLLCEIVTDAALTAGKALDKSCGTCDACLRVCPTGALVAPGVLDNSRCISFWTIEHRGVIPLELRPLIGEWVFGCDLCQQVCPVNRERLPFATDAFGELTSPRPLLEDLLAVDEEAFANRYRGTAIWRAKRSGLVRNACVALGNVGDRSSVPALAGALLDHAPLVRGHAAWALGRIGGRLAAESLQKALMSEPDEWVRSECEWALSEAAPLAALSPA